MSRADNTGSGLILAASPTAKSKYGITNVSRPRDLPYPLPKELHIVRQESTPEMLSKWTKNRWIQSDYRDTPYSEGRRAVLDWYSSLFTYFLRKPKSLEHSLVFKKTPKLRNCFLQYYQKTPRRFLQFIENHLSISLDQLIIHLEEAFKDHNVSKTPPNRAVNEARNQLQ